jgi:hypothetical protein
MPDKPHARQWRRNHQYAAPWAQYGRWRAHQLMTVPAGALTTGIPITSPEVGSSNSPRHKAGHDHMSAHQVW